MTQQPAPGRCAIYTRKSTEEGLEQEFNTLQAQRESAEACILSHREQGWTAISERYDDGGFSGANIDRPALKKLLAGVEAGQIDCVLVYKVDRLSRSLLDFARLMEFFEQHKVSFVSITQDFNTTTSLGRLTLNVLLSFAQFEREIISERTRDKVSAARRKGKWTGGTPVLGYDVDPAGGRLVVNSSEARQVQQLYRIYLESGSLSATLRTAAAQGITTKVWTSKTGTIYSGRPLSNPGVRLLLSNVLYAGSVRHKGTIHDGEHEAIIDQQLWDAVNAKLNENGDHLRGRKHHTQNAVLAQLVYCDQCQSAMFPTFTRKSGKRHRYYVCRGNRGATQPRCPQLPVAAMDLESSLMERLEPILGNQLSAPVIRQSVERVKYHSGTRQVSATLRNGTRFVYTLARPDRAGVRRTTGDTTTGGVPRISRLMALAIRLERLIGEGAVSNFVDAARLGGISRPRMSQIMTLTNLAPAIQEELLFLPKVLPGSDRHCEKALRQIAQVTDWDTQMPLFRSLLDGKCGQGR